MGCAFSARLSYVFLNLEGGLIREGHIFIQLATSCPSTFSAEPRSLTKSCDETKKEITRLDKITSCGSCHRAPSSADPCSEGR